MSSVAGFPTLRFAAVLGAPTLRELPYPIVCLLCGIVLGWLPWLFHGPIAEKFDAFFIDGSVAVWAWYTARMMIGAWVGLVTWPQRWWLRGPMCGLLAMLPVTIVSLAVPTCGLPCMGWNLTTGALVGGLVGAAAYGITGRQYWAR